LIIKYVGFAVSVEIARALHRGLVAVGAAPLLDKQPVVENVTAMALVGVAFTDISDCDCPL